MHQAAVVPDDQLVRLPVVLVGEVGMDGERVELVDQRAAFVVRHADDRLGVVAEVEAGAAGLGMAADDRVLDRRRLALLRLGHQVDAVAARAREVEVVDGAQAGDALLPRVAQPLVGAVHVAEVRLAAGLGNDLAVDDRRLAGDAPPRAVGVPVQRALVGMLAVGLAVGVEVRQPVQLREAVGVVHRHHVHLHLAELPRERDLRRRRQRRAAGRASTW